LILRCVVDFNQASTIKQATAPNLGAHWEYRYKTVGQGRLVVLGDQCEPVSTKRMAIENTRQNPGNLLQICIFLASINRNEFKLNAALLNRTHVQH